MFIVSFIMIIKVFYFRAFWGIGALLMSTFSINLKNSHSLEISDIELPHNLYYAPNYYCYLYCLSVFYIVFSSI